jgi:hypothetical protein
LNLLRSRSRRILAATAISIFAAAAAGALVSPASAGGTDLSTAVSGAFCSTDHGVFNGLSGLAPTSTARSGKKFVRERETRGIVADSEFSGPKPSAPASFSATIPVYFHVVTDGSTGRLSRSTVRDQINVLNLSFGGFYGGVDTGFRFTLAGLDFTNNAEWFAQETFAAEVAMKSALKKGDATALNIYSTSGGGFLGWAYYPKIVTSNQNQVLDGVVIHYCSVPGGPIEGFNLGYTATHEAGHWLGLAHTFEQGCQGHGDYVDDTPAEATPTSGCPIGKDTCTAPGSDPIHNYMDYSDDPCYNQFTAGQETRMQEQFLHWRVEHGY